MRRDGFPKDAVKERPGQGVIVALGRSVVLCFALIAIAKAHLPSGGRAHPHPAALNSGPIATDSNTSEVEPQSPDSGETAPNYVETIKSYPIHGDNFDQLWQGVQSQGPRDETGNSWHGMTNWYVWWNYTYATTSFGCSAADITVRTEAIIQMPDWVERGSASGATQEAWKAYWKRLLAHERGHARNGRHTANQVARAIRDLSPSATCDNFDVRANAAADAQIDKGTEMDRDYDARTNHGEHQGVVWPRLSSN